MTDPAPAADRFDEDEPRAHEDAFERLDDAGAPSDPRRSTATGRRAGSRIGLGFAIGTVAGALLGALVGSLAFETGSPGFWAAVVAGAVFGVLGGFLAGMSALGPPEVENDPLPPASDPADDQGSGRGGSSTVG